MTWPKPDPFGPRSRLPASRSEGDEYRELAQRLQAKCSSLKGAAAMLHLSGGFGDDDTTFNSRSYRDQSISKHLSELRQDNKKLLGDRESLRRLLADREEDVRLLRSELTADRKAREERAKQDREGCGQAQSNFQAMLQCGVGTPKKFPSH